MGRMVLRAALAVLVMGPAPAWAATVGPIPVTATVDQIESFSCGIRRVKNVNGVEVDQGPSPDMNFGTLLRLNTCGTTGDQPCALGAPHFFKVFCGTNTAGRPYTVRQTGTALTSGSNTLPNNAWVFVPIDLVDADGDGAADDPLPAGATIGTRVSANTASATWYSSGTGGKGVTIQSAYGVTGNPSATPNPTGPLIPPDQPAGAYTGTVTWTLTINP